MPSCAIWSFSLLYKRDRPTSGSEVLESRTVICNYGKPSQKTVTLIMSTGYLKCLGMLVCVCVYGSTFL